GGGGGRGGGGAGGSDGWGAGGRAAPGAGRREADLPPSAGDVAAVVYKLIEQWRKADPDAGIEALQLAPPSSKRPTYDGIVRQRAGKDGREIRTGLVFVEASQGRTTNSVFGRLVNDETPPDRVFGISDARKPLPFATGGQQMRESLQERGSERYRELALSFEEYAELDALLAVTRQARAGDLEVGAPPPVSEPEAVAALQRQGRYRRAPVLRELLRTLG